jgi:sugar O-acyltransferase (sialic acid O-acetyltransferase NeuD family)
MSADLDRQPIAVFGAGGFGLEVAMLIEQINLAEPRWQIVGFFDDGKPKGTLVNDWATLGGLKELNEWTEPLAVAFALGMPRTKRNVIRQLNNSLLYFPVLTHPSVICGPSRYVQIGEGTLICAGTIITTNIDIGRFVTINLACTVGHETVIGDYCSFMPTCNISGEVSVGETSFWGTGAKVINRVCVGAETMIGAGAVVISDIPHNATAVGVPAKVVKRR